MAPKGVPDKPAERAGNFTIDGLVKLQPGEDQAALELKAIAVGRDGQVIGESPVSEKGEFRIPVAISQPQDVQLLVGPGDDAESIRNSSAASRQFQASDWKTSGEVSQIRAELFIPRLEWLPWLPRKICVFGRVRKIHVENGVTDICSVPFAKVEIFDVDREGCFWPFLVRRLPDLLDRKVVRVPDLIGPRVRLPKPPLPDPPPFRLEREGALNPGVLAGFDPQPEPPVLSGVEHLADLVALNPQPLPPRESLKLAFSHVGEVARLAPALADRVADLTLSSRIAPWVFFPRCFYSRRLVCTTYTDNCGRFRCCFKWWPFHFRNGRLRFDSRPDIIVRVTQTINGVDRVLYLDPYTSTRWNVSSAYINVFVDDEDVRCGSCDPQPRPDGTQVFFTRIGNDEVYRINQGNGLYSGGGVTDMAYGSTLRVHAQFGDGLSNGAPARYYRLSYRKGANPWTVVDASLSDTRVNKATLFSESHTLGPVTVNGVPGLYEVRNFLNYYWYNPDWIGTWSTADFEPDTGLYTLRLEVFDQNGVKLTSATVDYRDGTVAPPAVLPPMGDQCDLRITLDNKAPVVNISIPAAINECGVVPWSPMLNLEFPISVSQENGRLNEWYFVYRKGVNPTTHTLASASSANGTPASVNQTVSGAPLLVGLTTTCAFDLELGAWAHIRNGYGRVYFTRENKAIAVEKCDCPDCQ